MKKIKGDLLKLARDGMFDVIVHGCNCFHVMGGGIALQIAKQFPEAYEVDKNETAYGDESKLGTYTQYTYHAHGIFLTIVNAYTQYDFGSNERKVSYDAVDDVFRTLAKDLHQTEAALRIGIPMIGAGLAGGDWDIIKLIIDKQMKEFDVTLVEFDPNV